MGRSATTLPSCPMLVRGLNVAAVPTTLLSNDPHFETMRGRVLEPELVGDLLRGVEERGLIETSRYIVSGYLGSRANGEVVAAFVKRAKQLNPNISYVCDPVMGDSNLGIFVADQVIECLLGQLVPLADLLTPNQFELGLIAQTQTQSRSWDELATNASRIQMYRGARLVITGCAFPDTPNGSLENVIFDGGMQTRLTSSRLPIVPVGAGDLFTGVLIANLAHGHALVEAARDAADVVLAVLGRTIAEGEHEMQLGCVIDALRKNIE